jgi:hypothetical protein
MIHFDWRNAAIDLFIGFRRRRRRLVKKEKIVVILKIG